MRFDLHTLAVPRTTGPGTNVRLSSSSAAISGWTPLAFLAEGPGTVGFDEGERQRMPFLVFYSWQSDLPNKTNRGLIEQALGRAVKVISENGHLEQAIRLDSDTTGVPGSPDIAET